MLPRVQITVANWWSLSAKGSIPSYTTIFHQAYKGIYLSFGNEVELPTVLIGFASHTIHTHIAVGGKGYTAPNFIYTLRLYLITAFRSLGYKLPIGLVATSEYLVVGNEVNLFAPK